MFFNCTAKAWKKAIGQVWRLRQEGTWKRIGGSDVYWTATFFEVLIETIDDMLPENAKQALELSEQGLLLTERIRVEDCPEGSEVGKSSLKVWAYAVHGSCCHAAAGREQEAASAFRQALALAPMAAPWAEGEAALRYAAWLFDQGDSSGLEYLNRALPCFEGFSVAQADALISRGRLHQHLRNDFASAAADFQAAIGLLDPKADRRQSRGWLSAVHHLGLLYSEIPAEISVIDAALKDIRGRAKGLSKNEAYRRMLCLWVQALLLAPMGVSRKAARGLQKARTWFFGPGHVYRGALCSVDLILLYLIDGDEIAADEALQELLARPGAGSAQLVEYLDHRLRSRHLQLLNEERRAGLREALLRR